MTRRTIAMLALTCIAVVLWLLRFVPTAGVPPDLADFFGGVAIGLGIGTVVAWAGDHMPPPNQRF